MRFTELPLEGAFTIELDAIRDHRGFNARVWCAREFEKRGLKTGVAQVNVIANGPRGTLRGLHYKGAPMAETNLLRVTRGAIFDVILDLRPGSPTFRQWTSVELHAHHYRMLYVPEGVAQGFQTLEDDTELTYQVSEFFSPEHGGGVRYDDPAFGITWPLDVTAISDRDLSWPDFEGDLA